MNTEHLYQFRKLSEKDNHCWKGRNLLRWWRSIFKNERTRLKSIFVSRGQLKKICKDPKYRDKEVLAAVMAWGGMPINNGERLPIKEICAVIKELRKGLSSQKAYSRFYNLYAKGKLQGIRPAYYTKLIFFCSLKHDGYIMDQWTSKSVNLIFGRHIVNLEGHYVSNDNDASDYREFCKAVRILSKLAGLTPEETEKRLFSYGWKKGKWRNYVKRHWKR